MAHSGKLLNSHSTGCGFEDMFHVELSEKVVYDHLLFGYTVKILVKKVNGHSQLKLKC